jgi:hypothetical protein
MNKRITTLEELRKEKEKLKIKMEVTKHAFDKGLGASRREAGRFFWSKLALPAILAGLTAKGVSNLFSANGQAHEAAATEAESDAGPSWLERAVPLVLSVLESFINESYESSENNA